MRHLLFTLFIIPFLMNATSNENTSIVTIMLDSTFTKESQKCYIGGWVSSDEYYIFDSAFIRKEERTIQMQIKHSIENSFSIFFSKNGPLNQDFVLEPNAEVILRVVPEMRREDGRLILSGKGSEAHNEDEKFRKNVINPIMNRLRLTSVEDSIHYYKQQISSKVIHLIETTSHPTVAYNNFLALRNGFKSFVGEKKIDEIMNYIKKKFPDVGYIQRLGKVYVPRELSEEAKRIRSWKTNIIAERYKALQQSTEIGDKIDLTFSDKNGIPKSLDDMTEEYVLVDIWASWCKPCLKEIPYIQNAMEKYKGRVGIYAISLDGYIDVWQKAIEDHKLYNFTHVIGTDNQGIPNKRIKRIKGIGVRAIPANILLNEERCIVAKNIYGDHLMQTLDSLMNQ